LTFVDQSNLTPSDLNLKLINLRDSCTEAFELGNANVAGANTAWRCRVCHTAPESSTNRGSLPRIPRLALWRQTTLDIASRVLFKFSMVEERVTTLEATPGYKRYQRLPPAATALLSDHTMVRVSQRSLRHKIEQVVHQSREAAERSAELDLLLDREGRRGFIEPESELERHTSHVSQQALQEASSLYAQRGRFRLDFEDYSRTRASQVLRKQERAASSNGVEHPTMGYRARYSASSRVLLLGGLHNGHVVVLDWRRKRTMAPELHLGEHLRDVVMLHTDGLFAAAVERAVAIHDAVSGAQIHCLRQHSRPHSLDFLRYHLLLLSMSETGELHYTDVSNGMTVAQFPTHLGRPSAALTTSPYHGVAFTGHANGTVQLWSPAMPNEPLAKVLAHPGYGGVAAVATDHGGRYLVTAGAASRHFAVWDMRKLFRPIHSYESKSGGLITSMDVSQTGLLAIGHSAGGRVIIWKDWALYEAKAYEPYLQTRVGVGAGGTRISAVAFAPFEDVLGVGYSTGFESCLVPGSGEPEFDALEPNPYWQKAQRRAAQVQLLLEKLPPETIALDPNFIGRVERDHRRVQRTGRRVSQLRYRPPAETAPNEAAPREDQSSAPEDAQTDENGGLSASVPPWRRRVKHPSLRKSRGRNALANRLRRRQQNVIDTKAEALRTRLVQMLQHRRRRRRRQRGHPRVHDHETGQRSSKDATQATLRSERHTNRAHLAKLIPRALQSFHQHQR